MGRLNSALRAVSLHLQIALFTSLAILFQTEVQAQSNQLQNITFQNTAPELSYTPPVCDIGIVDDIPANCTGTWTILNQPGSSNASVTSTEGPSEGFEGLIPQLFFTFRGSALFVKTSDISNATANLTVSSEPSGVVQSGFFEPSLDFWSFRDLDESQELTVVLTFASGSASGTHLDIDFIKISVTNASATSSIIPTQTFSPATFTPTIGFLTTAVPATASGRSTSLAQPIGTIVGETLAAVFGVLLLGLIVLVAWRWRRRRRQVDDHRQREMQAQAASQVLSQPRTVPSLPRSLPRSYAQPTPGPSRWRDSPRSVARTHSSAFADDGHGIGLAL